MQKAVTEVEVRRDAEEDPGRVDWVTSHPPLEQPPPPKKNIYIMEKQTEIRVSQKPCETNQPQMQLQSIEVCFVRNSWRCTLDE